MAAPSWRKIEAVLIELLRVEGFDIIKERGNSYITISLDDNDHDICIGDFARELEQRL